MCTCCSKTQQTTGWTVFVFDWAECIYTAMHAMAQCTAFREMKRPNRIVCAQLTIHNTHSHTHTLPAHQTTTKWNTQRKKTKIAHNSISQHTARWQLAFGAQMKTIQRETPSTNERKNAATRRESNNRTNPNGMRINGKNANKNVYL